MGNIIFSRILLLQYLLLEVQNGQLMELFVLLLCLLSTEILFYILLMRFKREKSIIISIFVFSLLGYIYSKYINIPLPWSIDVFLTAIVFFGAGYLFKEKILLFNRLINKKLLFILLICNLFFGGECLDL